MRFSQVGINNIWLVILLHVCLIVFYFKIHEQETLNFPELIQNIALVVQVVLVVFKSRIL